MIDLDMIMAPDFPEEEETEETTENLEIEGYFGEWARIRMEYLIEEKREMWKNLLAEGKAEEYLKDYQEKCEERYEKIYEQMMKKEGATEKLKAEDSMVWLQREQQARMAATEIMTAEISGTM